MSDAFYSIITAIGRPIFALSASPTVLHADRLPASGPVIVAANHASPYDVPLLMRHVRRRLDFVSITEVFAKPLVGWFYGSMNAFPLDRTRPDAPTVRTILDRLQRGRAVAMFPEGQIRPPERSVTSGASMRRGVGRLACLAGAPTVPVVLIGSGVYRRPLAWLPIGQTRYGVIFGEAIPPTEPAAVEQALARAYVSLHQALQQAMQAAGR